MKPRALTATGSSQRLSCNEVLVSPLSGLKRMPFGQSIYIPTLHPRGAGSRPRVPPSPSLRYPAFGSPRLSPLRPSLRSLSLVDGGIPPRVAGRSPPRLNPRLRFGHPARPPNGQLRCPVACTSIVLGALFVVALCLAAVGFASAFADAFACDTTVCALGCAAEIVPRLRHRTLSEPARCAETCFYIGGKHFVFILHPAPLIHSRHCGGQAGETFRSVAYAHWRRLGTKGTAGLRTKF